MYLEANFTVRYQKRGRKPAGVIYLQIKSTHKERQYKAKHSLKQRFVMSILLLHVAFRDTLKKKLNKSPLSFMSQQESGFLEHFNVQQHI